MEIRRINKTDEGVVGIIVTILFIGLILVIYATIQTYHLPQWLEQKEADHMHIVSNQFAQLKHSIDILSTIDQQNAISTYITLGTPDTPILSTGQTYDHMNLLSNTCSIEVSNSSSTLSFSIDTIKYSSQNSYFVDQSYIYEAGALILSQSSANLLNGKPFLSISNYTNITMTIINISGLGGKNSAGGCGTFSIYSEFTNSEMYIIENLESINITTNYPNAWSVFFNSTTLLYSGLNYDINVFDDAVNVEFSNPLGNLDLKVADISIQIAPGWIE